MPLYHANETGSVVVNNHIYTYAVSLSKNALNPSLLFPLSR